MNAKIYDTPLMKYTPAAAVDDGEFVVIGNQVFFANGKIAAAASGDLAKPGTVRVDVVDSVAIAQGDKLYWDPTNKEVTTTRGFYPFGFAAETHAASTSGQIAAIQFNELAYGRVKIYERTAASTALTNSATETVTDTITIPAGKLRAGESIVIEAMAIATATNSTDTLTMKVKIGSTDVWTSGALDATNDDLATVRTTIAIRTTGSSGTAVADSTGTIGPIASATVKPQQMASATVDTTAAVVITVTLKWSAASASDSARMDVCRAFIDR